MTTYQDILEKLKQSQLMQKFNANKQAMTNPQPSGFGHGIANLGMKMSQSQIPQVAKLGVGTQTLGNKLGALGAAKGLGNAGALGGAAGGALSKATPFLGGAMSGAQAAQDASRGDYIGAGLNGISAGASFVPGVGTAVAMGASALDSINKMFRGAKDRANQQAMQMSMQEAQNSEQANAESTAQLQNQFANNAMQYANDMAQPSTYNDIMSRIQPVGNVGSPTEFASGINLPSEVQTSKNNPVIASGIEEGVPTGGAASIKPLQVMDNGNGGAVVDKVATNALANQYQEPKESLVQKIMNGLGQFKAGYDDNSMNGFADGDLANKLAGGNQQQTPSNYDLLANDMKQGGYTDEQIQSAQQGLNGGNKDIAAMIDKYSIAKPTTDEDIALAQQGGFNNQGALTGGAATTKKTIMNRLGEAVGTGRRLMANPWVQAGIAAAISKADGGDIGDMAQAAYKYGTAKAMSDQYYKQLHPDAKAMPVLNTYGVDDYKAKAYNDFNQGRTVMSRRDLIKLQNPTMSDQDIEDLITKSGINGDEMVSIKGYETVEKAKNNTRKTDLQEDKNKWQRDQGQQKIGIQQQRVNNTKINSDRNYQLKLKTAQDKISKSNLKEQTKQELNRNLAKYSTIINDPNRSDEDKAKARQGMINTYGKDFLSVEANL